jgi:hypothetical protein
LKIEEADFESLKGEDFMVIIFNAEFAATFGPPR